MKKQIIFICNGNIERSVVAAQCLRNILKEKKIGSKFLVDSYGLQGTKGTALPKHKKLSEYEKEWKVAKPVLEKLKINVSDHSFQKITLNVAKKASVIIAMDNKVYLEARNSLIKQFPKQVKKIYTFSKLSPSSMHVRDPAGNSTKKFHRDVIKYIYTTLNKNYKIILAWVAKVNA